MCNSCHLPEESMGESMGECGRKRVDANVMGKGKWEVNNVKCVMQGIEEGMSQMAVQSHDGSRNLVWNFPIESWWRSRNPHGWPRLILCVYGPDARNNDIIHGYGSALLPFCPGLPFDSFYFVSIHPSPHLLSPTPTTTSQSNSVGGRVFKSPTSNNQSCNYLNVG